MESIALAVPNLPTSADGLRVAQISDIHFSKYTQAEKVASAVARINALAPDLVVITGDHIGHDDHEKRSLVEPLRQLTAPAFAVLGNHDTWPDRRSVRRLLEDGGVKVLINQSVEVAGGVHPAGVDDIWIGRPDLVQHCATSRSTRPRCSWSTNPITSIG
ncbi:MAG: metallophosphoesterase [Caldilineaceae bacterium]